MASSLARALCYSSLDRAAQTLPEHTELHCHHSSTTAACRSPSSICTCCSMETAPRPGLQSFCTGPWQTQLLLPKKPCSFWRKRLQKHFDTAFANITNGFLLYWQGFLHKQLQLCLWNSPQLLLNFPHLCHHAHKGWGCATAAHALSALCPPQHLCQEQRG